MRWVKLTLAAIVLAGLSFLGASCQTSSNPTAVPSAVPSETALSATPVDSATAQATAIITPTATATPAPAGSVAALAVTLTGAAQNLGALAGGDLTAAQLGQAMDELVATSRQMSQFAQQAKEGTPGVRQTVVQTMDQLAAMGATLRDSSAILTAGQRKLALQQAQVLTYDMAQLMLQVQGMTAQAGPTEEQPINGQLQQVQATIGYVLIQAGLATPTPAPSAVPTQQVTPSR